MTNDGALRRDRCVVCGGGALTPVVTMPAFPVFQGCIASPPTSDELAPMPWAACDACGSAQITELPPLARIYSGGHATGLGAAWARHHAAFAQFLRSHAQGTILDVGGGSGTLAAAFRQSGGREAWTILEPNALASPNLPADVRIVDGFLTRETLQRFDAQTVVMCHMLEHVVDLRATLDDLTAAAGADARIALAWPVLEEWTARGLAGALNFEHGVYVTLPRLKQLFAARGWRLIGEAQWAENNTAFLAFARGPVGASAAPRAASAAVVVRRYFARFEADAAALNAKLKVHDGDAFLMPASVYAQTLIAAGLAESRLSGLLDNAPLKQERRLSGTDLWVAEPRTALARARRPLVILNGGAHEAEMAANLRAVRDVVVIVRSAEAALTP